MGKKKRKSKKKSKSHTVDHHPEEANGTSPCLDVAPPGPRDSSVTMASIREYVKKEHVQYMGSEGDELSGDVIDELANAVGSAFTLKSGSNSFFNKHVGHCHTWQVSSLVFRQEHGHGSPCMVCG